MEDINHLVKDLIQAQLKQWELVLVNYAALEKVQTRSLFVNGYPVVLQFNPERIRSSAAKVDAKSLRERPCFLCPANLPAEQTWVPFGSEYRIMVNPYPIFPEHLTIPVLAHTEQRILPRMGDMLELAHQLPDFVIFYNGPKCGASAPDHMHFQAGCKGVLPIETDWKKAHKEEFVILRRGTLSVLRDYRQPLFVIESEDSRDVVGLFHYLYSLLEIKPGEKEPMMNILAWQEEERWITCVFPRRELRPSCYYAAGNKNIVVSPATVEMGGLFAVPLEKDYLKITSADIQTILQEVCLPEEEIDRLILRVKTPLS